MQGGEGQQQQQKRLKASKASRFPNGGDEVIEKTFSLVGWFARPKPPGVVLRLASNKPHPTSAATRSMGGLFSVFPDGWQRAIRIN